MNEGVYWRRNHQASHHQEDNYHQEDNNDPIQNVPLPSRLQVRGRVSKFALLFVTLCFLTWATSRILLSPLPRPIPQVATQGIIFELFQYYIQPHAYNRTFTHANSMHQRRRRRHVLDENKYHFSSNELVKSDTDEIYDDNDEYEKEPFDARNEEEFNVMEEQHLEGEKHVSKRGSAAINEASSSKTPTSEASSSKEAQGHWPLLGGVRESDLDIQAFFVKVPIGYGKKLKEYFLHIDTGSGITWLMCKGRGPITSVGPNGLFVPTTKSFMDCRNGELCSAFQEGVKLPCDERNQFKCSFEHEFGDGLDVRGHVVVGDVSFELNDGSKSRAQVAFGCADKVNDQNTKGKGKSTQLTDGLIGLGPHKGSWIRQMNMLGIIRKDVVAICIDPELHGLRGRGGPQLPTSVGFLSFGNLYKSKAAKWTANIVVPNEDGGTEPIYNAKMRSIQYRTVIIPLVKKTKKNGDVSTSNEGVLMGFDSGSDLTYLTKKIFKIIVQVLNNEAKSKGYQRTKDSDEFVKNELRTCWSNKGQDIPISEFGDLVFKFNSLANDGTTSDMVIKPQYYITSGGSNTQRTCFNMLEEVGFDYGNIGAELMKGHIFIFNNDLNQIGWRPIQSCKKLK